MMFHQPLDGQQRLCLFNELNYTVSCCCSHNKETETFSKGCLFLDLNVIYVLKSTVSTHYKLLIGTTNNRCEY